MESWRMRERELAHARAGACENYNGTTFTFPQVGRVPRKAIAHGAGCSCVCCVPQVGRVPRKAITHGYNPAWAVCIFARCHGNDVSADQWEVSVRGESTFKGL